MAAGKSVWSAVRERLQTLLTEKGQPWRSSLTARNAWVQRDSVTLHLPAEIGDYTDFYASKEHATNVGALFRGRENALLPNWVHIPIGYHGRSSSVVISGTPIRRPHGQVKPANSPNPVYQPTAQLDFELEIGFFFGGEGNSLGEQIPIDRATDHIFGMVLVNDWSARDIQAWEYQPLGPFLGKNFGTSVSGWVIPMEALAPFRVSPPLQDPSPLPYLQGQNQWGYDIHLEANLIPNASTERSIITETNARYLYWTPEQMLAHHTVNGCPMRVGDLLASGTISGSPPNSYGSLLELTERGAKPLAFANGQTRSFLETGDELILTGYCQGDGYRIGFGEVSGRVI
jgi:fumarylacetoacetase